MAIAAIIAEIRRLFQKPPRLSFPVIQLPGWVAYGGSDVPYNFSYNPMAPSGAVSGFGGGSDWLSGLGSLAQGVGGIISAIRMPQAAPGGFGFVAPAMGTAGRVIGGIAAGAAGAGIADWLMGNGGACPTSPFASGGGAPRAQTFVAANPATGKATWFKPAGRPLLWSGDLSAARRVRKIAGRARRRVGGR